MARVFGHAELLDALGRREALIEIAAEFFLESAVEVDYALTVKNLDGEARRSLTRDPGYDGALFSVLPGGALTLRDLIIDGNKAAVPVALPIITCLGALTMRSVGLRNNAVERRGAGILADSTDARLDLSDCAIEACESGGDGAGAYVKDNDPQLTRCVFSGNVAHENGGGGGLFFDNSRATLDDCAFSGNAASSGGGICALYGSHARLTDCAFENNAAHPFEGGGAFANHSNLQCLRCTFTVNTAFNGGGLMSAFAAPTLTDCAFERNTAGQYGGGAHIDDEGISPVFTRCRFLGNQAEQGGGIGFNIGTPVMTDCEIRDNRALYGGGVFGQFRSAQLRDCVIEDNAATTSGGGVYQSSGEMAFTGGRIAGNRAEDQGGGLFMQESHLELLAAFNGADIQGNTAKTGGGACVSSLNALRLESGGVFGNRALQDGGGIWLAPEASARLGPSANVNGNAAQRAGADVHSGGALALSGAVVISDGLYLPDADRPVQLLASVAGSLIRLEPSPHIRPDPAIVPIGIAEASASYPALSARDAAAFLPPVAGFAAWGMGRNPENTRVVLDLLVEYAIRYSNLCGAHNPNPERYDAKSLPIRLLPLCPPDGWCFEGWLDAAGNRVFEIPIGATGELALAAVWRHMPVPPCCCFCWRR